MIEGPDTPVTADEDTISLIDLVVVVLRRRRLIIISTVTSIIIGLALVLVLPGYQYNKAVAEQIAEGNTTFMISSALKAILGEGESTNFISQAMNDPLTILQALRKSGYTKLDDKTLIDTSVPDQKAIFSIRRRFLQNKGPDGTALKPEQFVYRVALANGAGTVTFKDKDEEKVAIFLATMINTVNGDIAVYIQPYARSRLEAYEALLSIEKPSEVAGITIVQNYENYSLIKNYLREGQSPITILREPYAFKAELSIDAMRTDVRKKAIILVFGVFFMAVFAAFVLHYVDTVRKDSESMDKLREALVKRNG